MDQGLIKLENNILKDPEKNDQLTSEGYCIFPFLQETDIKELVNYYFSSQPEDPQHFYSSTHSADFKFRKTSSEFIKKIVSERITDFLVDYKLLGGAFVIKPPHGKGLLPPHQDWNIVDEEKTRSYNLWIPLVNVTVENGAVHVLKGSHNRIPTYRGPGIDSIFKNIEKHVWLHLKPLIMGAGEALLYDHALLHASPVNQSNEIRLGIVCGVIPLNSNMQLHFHTGSIIATYEADESFFLKKNPSDGPQDLCKLEKEFSIPECLSVEKFNSIFLDQPRPKSGFFKRIFAGKK